MGANGSDVERLPAVADSTLHLSEVQVVADRYRRITPSQRLTGNELKALNSHSVADVIRYFSGVQIKDYGGVGGLKTVDVRSLGSNHVGVFYDGLPVGNAQNGQVDLGKFSLDNIEEVSLYNGQKGEVLQTARDYGSSASIYLRTRRPYFEENKRFNLKASVRAGSFYLISPSLLYEQKITEYISASVNAEYLKSSGKYKFRYRRAFPDGTIAWDTTYRRQNGEIEAFRVEGGLNGWMPDGKWNVKAYYYDSDRGIPGAVINNIAHTGQHQWDRNFFVQGALQKKWSAKAESMFNAKYARDYLRYKNPDTDYYKPADDRFTQRDAYFSLANRYTIRSNWDVSLSVDYQWNRLDVEKQYERYTDYSQFSPERHTVLVALATAFDLNQRLKLQGNVLATLVKDDNRQRWRNEYSPALFLYYKPFGGYNFHLRAFYKKIFRMPTFNDLYYTDVKQVNLNPERTTQYNLGLVWDIAAASRRFRATIEADAYYNEVTDKIIATPQGSGMYRFTVLNLGKVEIKGIDVSARMSYRFPCDLLLNTKLQYTYQKAQDFSYPEDKDIPGLTWGGQIPYVPWHSGSVVVGAQWKGWNMNYSFIYVGERYDSSDNDADSRRQPFYTSDLSLFKTIKYKAVLYKLTAEVNNLFDQQYDVIPNYPMPGRNYRVTLSIEL